MKDRSRQWCCCSLSPVWLLATPWTVPHKAPLSIWFFLQEYWREVPFPSPGDLPNPGIKSESLASLPLVPFEKPQRRQTCSQILSLCCVSLDSYLAFPSLSVFRFWLLMVIITEHKCQAGWITSWNQDCQKKYQQCQICRWYHSNGRKQRGTKEPLDESERGEWICWLKVQHSENEYHDIQSHHSNFLGLQNHCGWWMQPWN